MRRPVALRGRRLEMKLRVALFVVVLTFLGAFWVIGVSSQEAEQSQATGTEETPEAMWMKLAQPGEHHARLKAMVGDWKMTGKSWMTPGVAATMWDGVSEKKMLLGDRYLQETVHSQMMGMPFNGIGVLGYDNVQGKYLWSWIDDMGTGMMLSEGSCDKSGKVLTMVGEYLDPTMEANQTVRTVINIVSENKHTFEMYTKGPDTPEFKNMEIVYERGK
jgi:hypothetical protein